MKIILEKNTGKVLYGIDDDNYLCESEEIATNILLVDNFIKPYFDFKTASYYEGATEEEILEYNNNNNN